jgi:hypothetical protein
LPLGDASRRDHAAGVMMIPFQRRDYCARYQGRAAAVLSSRVEITARLNYPRACRRDNIWALSSREARRPSIRGRCCDRLMLPPLPDDACCRSSSICRAMAGQPPVIRRAVASPLLTN